MTEPETEAETLDRLEAALARIALHATPATSRTPRGAPHQPADPALIEALDQLIIRLRSALQPPHQEG